MRVKKIQEAKELFCSLYPESGEGGFQIFVQAILAANNMDEKFENMSSQTVRFIILKIKTLSEKNIGLIMLGYLNKQKKVS